MDIEQLKQKDIVSYLASCGLHPKKNNGKTAVYLSPVGEESKASLMVDTCKNRYTNYSTGKFGDIIDLIQEIDNCDFKTACNTLSGGSFNQIDEYTPPPVVKKGVEVHSVSGITDKDLISYFCDIRKINYNVLIEYCKQLVISFPHGKNPHAMYTVCGFKNDMHGWDCRSSWQKVATSPKTITTIKGNDSKIAVWEGFSDFMAHLTYHKIIKPKYKTIVLNGLGQIRMLKPFLEGKNVLYYGDNDKPSDNCLESMTNINVEDMRGEFAFYSDYNDFLMNL